MSVIIVPECFQDSHQVQDLTVKNTNSQPDVEPPSPAHHQCPQCGISSNQSALRLVHDTCGHLKCRLCLVKEENGCQTCEKERIKIYSKTFIPPVEAPIRTPVIEERAPVVVQAPSQAEKSPLQTAPPPSPEPPPSPPPESSSSPPPPDKRRRKPMIIDKHIVITPDNPPLYKCTVCVKTFKSRTHIRYHQFCASGHKPFRCETCGQGFVTKAHFEYHVRNHEGLKPFVCSKCKKAFNQKGKLTRHMRLHTGERPFVCEVCGRGFSNTHSLGNHKMVHTGERPHACPQCGKRFTETSNLKKHLMVHSNERPHMCEDCGKSFSLRWALNLHRRTHTRERDFHCSSCSRAFSNNRDLKRHTQVHSGTRVHTCPICNAAIRRKDNLERHIRNTHPEAYGALELAEVTVTSQPELPRANAVPVINSAPSSSGILPPLPPVPQTPVETQQCHGYTTRNLHPENSPHLFISSKNLTPL